MTVFFPLMVSFGSSRLSRTPTDPSPVVLIGPLTLKTSMAPKFRNPMLLASCEVTLPLGCPRCHRASVARCHIALPKSGVVPRLSTCLVLFPLTIRTPRLINSGISASCLRRKTSPVLSSSRSTVRPSEILALLRWPLTNNPPSLTGEPAELAARFLSQQSKPPSPRPAGSTG